MKKLKYVKLYEEITNKSIKILKIDGMNVTILNPDGKEIVVQMEDDGEYEEWIERPYEKVISVSGDDGTYRYSMSAHTDTHNTYYEIQDDEWDWESFKDIEIKKSKRAERVKVEAAERQARYERDQAEHASKVKASGKSLVTYQLDEELNRINVYAKHKGLPSINLGEGSKFVIEFMYLGTLNGETEPYESYILIPIPEVTDGFGSEFTDMMLTDDILNNIKKFVSVDSGNQAVIVGARDRNIKIGKITNINEYPETLKKYLEQVPQYADVEKLIHIHKQHAKSK